jgi:hypothetical protein
MSATIEWGGTLDKMGSAVRTYGEKVEDATEEVAKMLAQDIEKQMKARAPWKDQTGQARRKLEANVNRAARDVVELFIRHGVDYGVYLELSNNQRYAIIQPTMQRMYPVISRSLQGIFK